MKFTLLKKLMIVSALCVSPLLTATAEIVNINDASAAAMAHYLKGIGEVKAKSIVDYRELNGDFTSVNDLANVKGIGQGILKKNLEDLSLNEGVVKWIKAEPKVVALEDKSSKESKVKKLNVKKVASKSVGTPTKKKIKKEKTINLGDTSAVTKKRKAVTDKTEFMK